jgi:Nucleotidyl transferase AbiEii toxin, Type IV TA system
MTAEEIYESVTNGGSGDFAEATAIFDGIGRWCLVGGLAINCYVEPVYTIDADIVAASDDLARVRESLTAADFHFEFPHSLNASKAGSKLRIQFTQDSRYQDFIGRAERREVLGNLIPVARLEDIMQGKIWAWNDPGRRPTKRKKDELDLMRIAEAYPELRPLVPSGIVSQL